MNEHKPRFRFDCDNCKFEWTCGYCCRCLLKDLPDPPREVQLRVNEELILNGLEPDEFPIGTDDE